MWRAVKVKGSKSRFLGFYPVVAGAAAFFQKSRAPCLSRLIPTVLFDIDEVAANLPKEELERLPTTGYLAT